MDDLDHSVHISERDWMIFCQESEECRLPRPSLAAPDPFGLSDSEDSEDRRGGGRAEATGGSSGTCGETSGEESASARVADLRDGGAGDAPRLEVKPGDGRPPTPDPAAAAGRPAEKERWFVTVEVTPGRKRARAPAGKKKRRQKRAGRENEKVWREASSAAAADEPSQHHLGAIERNGSAVEPAGLKRPSESDEPEFFSLHGSDSDGYQSAAENREGDCPGHESELPSGVEAPSGSEGPESFAAAAGHLRPVYAISAFWHEMEKLTIKDILQLREARSPPPPADTEEERPSDAGDSDYFTQPDESKPDGSGCEFCASDFEEEHWQVLGSRGNDGMNPPDGGKADDEEEEEEEDEESTSSEGQVTPVPLECLESQFSQTLFSEEPMWTRPVMRTKSVHNIPALQAEDLPLPGAFQEDGMDLGEHLGSLALLLHEGRRSTFPEVEQMKNRCFCASVFHVERISTASVDGCHVCFSFPSLLDLLDPHLCAGGEPIPIFSCSPLAVRELTFPIPDQVPWGADPSGRWKTRLPLRNVCLHDKWSVWRRRPGARLQVPVLCEGDPDQPGQRQRTITTTPAPSQERLFSVLRHSDMCLVCIAFASWVMTSCDQEAADAWKAALLANVSALSAIRYLRRYVRRDDP